MGRTAFIAAAALAFVFTVPVAAGPDEEKAPDRATVGRPAPEFDAREWIGGDGRTSIADFRGEVVLLEFWGTR